jgi:hypothetical protein
LTYGLEEAVIFFQNVEFFCNNHNESENDLYENVKVYLYCLAFLNSCLGFKEIALSYAQQGEVMIIK